MGSMLPALRWRSTANTVPSRLATMRSSMNATLSDRDLLRRLVAFPSVSGAAGAGAITKFVRDYLDRPGVSFADADGGAGNVVAWRGPDPGPDRSGLVLSGHLDVVPAGEPGWDGDPFELRERNGRLYGRGACDMKGFVALAMNVFLACEPDTLTRPLVLLLTDDEEIGSLGAQRLAAGWPDDRWLPRSALIGEPTGLRAVSMHKGHLKLRIDVPGRSAHSGSPHLGRNAIERAGLVLSGLRGLREELERERRPTSAAFDDVPFPVLNVGRITGGDAINVVPDRCTIEIGARLLPGDDTDVMIERVRAAAAPPEDDRESAVRVEVINDSPPMLLDESATVYRDLCSLTGQTETLGVSFSSDAGVLARDMGMECVLFGPGSMDVAHRPNEFVATDDLERARTVLQSLVRRGCGGGPG